jgi:hypothetical protein
MATNVDIKWRGNKYSLNVQKAMINAVNRSAIKVNTATKKALSVSGAFPGEPSAPGDPPHKQGGHLRSSIQVERAKDGFSAKVGPADNLVYARIQELGGKTSRANLPARPYLEPSFQKCLPQIKQWIAGAMKKAGTT